MGLVPLATFALISPVERGEAVNALDAAIHRAAGVYRSRPKVTSLDPVKLEERLGELTEHEKDLRLTIEVVERGLERFGNAEVADKDVAGRQALTAEGRERFAQFIRASQARESTPTLLLSLFSRSLGVQTESARADHTFTNLQLDLLTSIFQAEAGPAYLKELRKELSAVESEYDRTFALVEHAGELAGQGGTLEEEAREIVEEVHREVLRLQGELARIDVRLRERAERVLIEKGLRAPRDASASGSIVPHTPAFTWPVFGPISAGFLDENYEHYFGIPHKGVDIVVPQSSPVVAAAEGVVFLVRDGGEMGYSYVLIGHRGGFATLYGHLSSITAVNGQEVAAGQIIGASGGEPGTHGAGPITTGPHLHFEVIQGGVNTDPREMLP
jgi:murein DD-endopeptidase MepM/ murein hydrolase activator NlpD